VEKAKKIINLKQDVRCTREYYKRLREHSLLVTGYIGRWCNILVLKTHAPTEEKCNDLKTVLMLN